ncbi:hypothetical protein ACFQJC_16520 [Haloferax namakaokahaiae]|uniref:Restriction endonuclease n=1 Tax=Haloferax namakaokahaiae TaxID=1748331 RepID=A0ABD5ZIT8_9EURY
MSEESDDTDYFDYWNASKPEFNEVFNRNPSLMGMMKGYMAEEKLKVDVLEQNPRVQNLHSPDDHDRELKGDWRFDWDGEEHIIVEVKCLQSNYVEARNTLSGEVHYTGKYQCDASDRREIELDSGETVETTLLEVGEFDILAVGIFEFGNEWNFVFAKNEDLPKTTYHSYSEAAQDRLIKGMHNIEYPLPDDSIYSENIWPLVEETVAER